MPAITIRRTRPTVTLNELSLQLALSAIGEGLSSIRRGRAEAGVRCAEYGLEFLREHIGEAAEHAGRM